MSSLMLCVSAAFRLHLILLHVLAVPTALPLLHVLMLMPYLLLPFQPQQSASLVPPTSGIYIRNVARGYTCNLPLTCVCWVAQQMYSVTLQC